MGGGGRSLLDRVKFAAHRQAPVDLPRPTAPRMTANEANEWRQAKPTAPRMTANEAAAGGGGWMKAV